jgi:hypothetical protein
MRDDTETEYFLDVHEYSWTGTVGQPAGIFWIDGTSVIAAHASRTEQQLLARGAILVATLLFGRDPLEASHPGRAVERVSASAVAMQIEPPSGN